MILRAILLEQGISLLQNVRERKSQLRYMKPFTLQIQTSGAIINLGHFENIVACVKLLTAMAVPYT